MEDEANTTLKSPFLEKAKASICYFLDDLKKGKEEDQILSGTYDFSFYNFTWILMKRIFN